MKSIYSLTTDIQYLLTQRGWVTPEIRQDLSDAVGRRLEEQFAERHLSPTLRLSRMGPQCPCALWHSIHLSTAAEPLPPWAEFKYSFGHIIEAQAIMLAKAAGHLVTGEQDEVVVDDVTGHRDCVIDGCIVDVKSVNGRGFENWKNREVGKLDDWGYLSQLDGYLVGSQHDPLVTVKDRAYILAIHKELGHMTLYEHHLREDHIRARIRQYKSIIGESTPPACECRTTTSTNGNIVLAYPATYNPFKYCCFPKLRTFIYSDGPQYFVHVNKVPTYKGQPLLEVDRSGKKVYN